MLVSVGLVAEAPADVFMRGAVGCEQNDEEHQDASDKGCPAEPVPEPPPPPPPVVELPEIVELVPPPAPPVPQQQVLGDREPLPVLGQTVVVEAIGNGVRVRRRGSRRFVPLTNAQGIPVGSTVDPGRGTVRMTSAANKQGGTQTGDFRGTRFVVSQRSSNSPVTVLKLTGPITPPGEASAAARRRRSLFGSGRGRFRTRGRHGSATVRGTKWITEDRPNGTLFRVKEGEVVVRDFTVGRLVTVRAGQRYFAPAVRPPVRPVFTG